MANVGATPPTTGLARSRASVAGYRMKRTVKSASNAAAMTAALSAIRVPGSTFSHASPRLAIPSANPATGVGKLRIRSERLARMVAPKVGTTMPLA